MNCCSKTEGQQELIQGFQNFRKHGPTERPALRQVFRKSEREKSTSVFWHALCNSFLSIVHELYSGLSATTDRAWWAQKLLHNWYQFTFVGENVL